MFKHLAAMSVIALCCAAAAASADTNNHVTANATAASTAQAPLPSVDAMTCNQMQAEMTADGQVMSHQLDPQFGADAQAQYNEAMQKEREINQQAPANALACMIPFMCAAAQHHQQQQAQADMAQNQAHAQTQMNRMNASMNGLDQARMQAINNRWQAQHCQASQH
jgi:hypothetical protein